MARSSKAEEVEVFAETVREVDGARVKGINDLYLRCEI